MRFLSPIKFSSIASEVIRLIRIQKFILKGKSAFLNLRRRGINSIQDQISDVLKNGIQQVLKETRRQIVCDFVKSSFDEMKVSFNHHQAGLITFKSYMPLLFEKLLRQFGYNLEDITKSLNSCLLDFRKYQRSQGILFLSSDRRLVIKNVTRVELDFMRSGFLNRYFDYVADRKETFLCRFLGAYKIRISRGSVDDTLYFVLMENVFFEFPKLCAQYELKGSSRLRVTPENQKRRLIPVLFEDEFLRRRKSLGVCGKGVDTLKSDLQFLRDNGVSSYSVLVGYSRGGGGGGVEFTCRCSSVLPVDRLRSGLSEEIFEEEAEEEEEEVLCGVGIVDILRVGGYYLGTHVSRALFSSAEKAASCP
jgi:hypothetical protein